MRSVLDTPTFGCTRGRLSYYYGFFSAVACIACSLYGNAVAL